MSSLIVGGARIVCRLRRLGTNCSFGGELLSVFDSGVNGKGTTQPDQVLNAQTKNS
jgi:hypothetical protein